MTTTRTMTITELAEATDTSVESWGHAATERVNVLGAGWVKLLGGGYLAGPGRTDVDLLAKIVGLTTSTEVETTDAEEVSMAAGADAARFHDHLDDALYIYAQRGGTPTLPWDKDRALFVAGWREATAASGRISLAEAEFRGDPR